MYGLRALGSCGGWCEILSNTPLLVTCRWSDMGPWNTWSSTVFFCGWFFYGNGAMTSHWWLELSGGLPKINQSSQACHYFLATVEVGGRDVGQNQFQLKLTWRHFGKLQEASDKTRQRSTTSTWTNSEPTQWNTTAAREKKSAFKLQVP